MKIFLFILILFLGIFIYCSLRIASISDSSIDEINLSKSSEKLGKNNKV